MFQCVCVRVYLCVWYVDTGLERMEVWVQTKPRSDGLEMIYWPVAEIFNDFLSFSCTNLMYFKGIKVYIL